MMGSRFNALLNVAGLSLVLAVNALAQQRPQQRDGLQRLAQALQATNAGAGQ